MADKILFTTDGNLQAGGDIHWMYCTVVNSESRGGDSNQALDILAMVPEINLFEDIFSHTMHGSLVMVDTHNLINEFPFVGQETMFLGFKTPSTENKIEKVFKIFKVSDRVIEGNKQVYKLHFMSADAWADVRYSNNRAFRGTPGTIIKQILTQQHNWDNFYTTSIPKPSLDKIKTNQLNEVKLVSPQWSTFDCIKWCEKMSLNARRYADYLFYESNTGYHFESLTDLFKQPAMDFFRYDHSQPAGNPVLQLMKIIDLQVPQVNDNLTRFLHRAYGHTVYNNDMFSKQVTTSKWGWTSGNGIPQGYSSYDYNVNSTTTGQFPMLTNTPNFNIATDHNVSVTNMNRYTHDMIDTEQESNLTRLPALNFLELQKMNIEVWGRTWLEVGNTVTVVMGKYEQTKDAELNGDDEKNSAIWLISAIHHRLAPSQHKMILQLVRNSSYEKYNPLVAN